MCKMVGGLMKYNDLKRFKNIHSDKCGIAFGTGPSLNKFDFNKLPGNRDDYITTGVNDMVYYDKIDLDYYFCGDHKNNTGSEITGIPYLEQIKLYKKNRLKGEMFCNVYVDDNEMPSHHFTKSEALEIGANICGQITGHGTQHIKKDIHNNAFYNHSIIYSSLQFILYTGVQKLYLVGCDAGGGSSYLEKGKEWPDSIISFWGDFKEFLEREYPNVKVISINPNNLRGWFDDEIM